MAAISCTTQVGAPVGTLAIKFRSSRSGTSIVMCFVRDYKMLTFGNGVFELVKIEYWFRISLSSSSEGRQGDFWLWSFLR